MISLVSSLPDLSEKNAESIKENAIVTACVSEYAALKAVKQDKIEILSIEDLILGE